MPFSETQSNHVKSLILQHFICYLIVSCGHVATKDDAPQVIHQGEHKKTISCMRDWAGGVDTSSHVKYRCSVQNEADEYMNLYETWSKFIKLFMIVHYI